MEIFEAVILSIVEGLTEFLPVSSTGHLVLTAHILNIPQVSFTKTFEIAIQSGAIAAALLLYANKLILNPKLVKNVLTAFIPTALVGFILYRPIKENFIGNINLTIAALFFGGIFIILFEKFFSKKSVRLRSGSSMDALSLSKAVVIGIFQSISVIPGVSRALASIIGGELVGLSRRDAVEFSFILAIPTLFAATGFDLIKSYKNFSAGDLNILIVGFAGSFLVALATMKWFIKFIKTSNLTVFGIYRIIAAAAFLIFQR